MASMARPNGWLGIKPRSDGSPPCIPAAGNRPGCRMAGRTRRVRFKVGIGVRRLELEAVAQGAGSHLARCVHRRFLGELGCKTSDLKNRCNFTHGDSNRCQRRCQWSIPTTDRVRTTVAPFVGSVLMTLVNSSIRSRRLPIRSHRCQRATAPSPTLHP